MLLTSLEVLKDVRSSRHKLQAADIGKALELLWKVVFIEHWVCTVLYHLQRHCSEHRRKLVDALGPTEEERTFTFTAG